MWVVCFLKKSIELFFKSCRKSEIIEYSRTQSDEMEQKPPQSTSKPPVGVGPGIHRAEHRAAAQSQGYSLEGQRGCRGNQVL